MSVYPSNFRVNAIAGQKTFEFDKDPQATLTTFHREVEGEWVYLGKTDTESFPIESSISGIYRTKGDSTVPNLPPPPPKFEDVNY
jgi:hypothetical protein